MTRARAAKRPSTSVAKASAGYLFRALDYEQRLLRVDMQLNAVYAVQRERTASTGAGHISTSTQRNAIKFGAT